MDILKRNLSLRLCNVQQVVMALKFRRTCINILKGVICCIPTNALCILHTIIYANINCAVFLHQSHVVAIYCAIFVLDIPVASANCWAKLAVLKIGNLQAALQHFTRRPASADRTARRQFQATGQPVNRTQVTQASDAMTSRLPRYRRSVCHAGASNAGRSLCVQISRERSYPLPITDRSFRYVWPCLWNQLPSSLRQPIPVPLSIPCSCSCHILILTLSTYHSHHP